MGTYGNKDTESYKPVMLAQWLKRVADFNDCVKDIK